MKHIFLLALLVVGCGSTDPASKSDTQNPDPAPTDDAVHTTDTGRAILLLKSGRRVHLDIDGSPKPEQRALIIQWTTDALRAVSAYYGRPPVDDMRVVVTIRSGRGVDDGVTRVEGDMPTIRITLGTNSTAGELSKDWVLTHEMVHTAFPDLAENHHWLEEGLATYVEPIARAGAGLESEADVWKQLVEGLPKGQPGRDDRGLDHTPTWGRTYWGGALFCTLADVGIRERTQNKYGLRDALKSLVDAGLTIEKDGDLPTLFARMDKTVGAPVLSELYAQHADAAVHVDLDDLWKRLGIAYGHRRVTFDDSAPEAAVRRAITQ